MLIAIVLALILGDLGHDTLQWVTNLIKRDVSPQLGMGDPLIFSTSPNASLQTPNAM